MTGISNARILLGRMALLATVAWPASLFSQDMSASITEAEIRDHLFFLASDALGGRDTGTEEFRMAAEYAASQLRAAGVQPLLIGSDGASTYFQPMPLTRVAYGPGSGAVLRWGGEERDLELGRDYVVVPRGLDPRGEAEGALVFVGYGVEAPDSGWRDLAGTDLARRIPVVLFGWPGAELTEAFVGRQEGDPWAEMGERVRAMEARGADGVVAVLSPDLWRAWRFLEVQYASEHLLTGRISSWDFPDVGIPVIYLSQDVLGELFADAPFDPLTREGEYGSFMVSDARLRVTTDLIRDGLSSPNVVGWVEGTDSVLKEEYVVVGAHLDHVGSRGGEVYNGADDNASGSVGVLEIAEAIALAPPRRSTLFVLYTGEERGLLGSSYFVEHSPVPLEQIVAKVNIEMIGRYEHRPLGTDGLFAIIGTEEGGLMRELLAEVNDDGFGYEWEIPDEFMSGSDHAAFERVGIPNVTVAASPPYGTHSDYHRPGDDAEKISIGGMRKAAAFIYRLTMALANTGRL